MPHALFAPLALPHPNGAPPRGWDVQFRFGPNNCIYWTLQGSSNLVDWVDLKVYGIGCPTNTENIVHDRPQYFYRLKGHE